MHVSKIGQNYLRFEVMEYSHGKFWAKSGALPNKIQQSYGWHGYTCPEHQRTFNTVFRYVISVFPI